MKLSEMKPKTKPKATHCADAMTVLQVDITELRKSRGISLHQASEAIGIKVGVLFDAERGKTPRLDTALRLAEFIDLPVEKIWMIRRKRRVA